MSMACLGRSDDSLGADSSHWPRVLRSLMQAKEMAAILWPTDGTSLHRIAIKCSATATLVTTDKDGFFKSSYWIESHTLTNAVERFAAPGQVCTHAQAGACNLQHLCKRRLARRVRSMCETLFYFAFLDLKGLDAGQQFIAMLMVLCRSSVEIPLAA